MKLMIKQIVLMSVLCSICFLSNIVIAEDSIERNNDIGDILNIYKKDGLKEGTREYLKTFWKDHKPFNIYFFEKEKKVIAVLEGSKDFCLIDDEEESNIWGPYGAFVFTILGLTFTSDNIKETIHDVVWEFSQDAPFILAPEIFLSFDKRYLAYKKYINIDKQFKVDLKTTQELMGHSSIQTTELYLHSNDDKKFEAVWKLNF